MAYAASADVESEFKNIAFTSTSNVTTTDVAAFITQADALINSYIGMRYQTPVTANEETLALLQLLSVTLVADRIRKILEVKQASPNDGANQSVRGFSSIDVMKLLTQIKDGKMTLAGATPLVSGGGFYSNNYAESVVPVFKKDEVNW